MLDLCPVARTERIFSFSSLCWFRLVVMQKRGGGLSELFGAIYAMVSAFFLIIGAYEYIAGHHHPVDVWLVIGSWCVTFGVLAWAVGLRRSAHLARGGDPHMHLPPLEPGQILEGELPSGPFKIVKRDQAPQAGGSEER
jgi:hypothetical protein